MFGLSWKLLAGASLALSVCLGWGFRVDHLRASWKGKYETLHGEADKVVVALKDASGNRKLEWASATGQAVALGESNRSLKSQIEVQNQRIDDMAREAVEMRARSGELKRIAAKAEAQRRAALSKLSDLSITPGTRGDCVQLRQEANQALDIVYKAGL